MSRMGGTGSAIQSIDIVKNEALEEAFQRKIREFKLKGIPSDVIFAYHGTPATNLDSILKDNFDLRKAKRQAYGPGIYFSEYPPTALHYSHPRRHLILCKILPGNQYKGGNMSWPGFQSKLVQPGKEDYSQMVIINESDQILPCSIIYL